MTFFLNSLPFGLRFLSHSPIARDHHKRKNVGREFEQAESVGQRERLALMPADAVERHHDAVLWVASCDLVQMEVELGFVEGLNHKIGVLQRRADGLRGTEYLRLKILTCMLPEA